MKSYPQAQDAVDAVKKHGAIAVYIEGVENPHFLVFEKNESTDHAFFRCHVGVCQRCQSSDSLGKIEKRFGRNFAPDQIESLYVDSLWLVRPEDILQAQAQLEHDDLGGISELERAQLDHLVNS